nr:MAG TPA: hypothetical protein [Caudoviricetes sp.]
MENTQSSLFGKMYQERSPRIMGMTFKPCLAKSHRPIFQCLNLTDGQNPEWQEVRAWESRGEHWTPNTGEFPNVAKESFLSQVLERSPVKQKYYLSPLACKGILRRAEGRHKELPPELKKALIRQSTTEQQAPSVQMTVRGDEQWTMLQPREYVLESLP